MGGGGELSSVFSAAPMSGTAARVFAALIGLDAVPALPLCSVVVVCFMSGRKRGLLRPGRDAGLHRAGPPLKFKASLLFCCLRIPPHPHPHRHMHPFPPVLLFRFSIKTLASIRVRQKVWREVMCSAGCPLGQCMEACTSALARCTSGLASVFRALHHHGTGGAPLGQAFFEFPDQSRFVNPLPPHSGMKKGGAGVSTQAIACTGEW